MKLFSVMFGVLLALAAVSIAHSQVSMEIGIRLGPPAPRYEREIDAPPPYERAIWVRGHWMWDSHRHRYIWTRGHWLAARPSYLWVDGSWHRGPRGWGWREGYWQRAEYSDNHDCYYDYDSRYRGGHDYNWNMGRGKGKKLGHYKNGKR